MSDLIDFSPPGQTTFTLAGAKARFYDAGTTNLRTVYSDEALTVAHPSPLLADSNGRFAQAFIAGGTRVKCVVTRSTDATGYTLDPCGQTSIAGTTFDTLDGFLAASMVSPINQALVEGRSLVSDAGGNITATNGRTWRVAGGDLPLTMCGSDSDLSSDFPGILQQAINDAADGLYDRLVFDPKRDGTPYAEAYFADLNLPAGDVNIHFDHRAIIKPQVNFQQFATGGAVGPFTITAFPYSAATWGNLSAGLVLTGGTWASPLTLGADFTVSGTAVTLTVAPPAGSTLVISGTKSALRLRGTRGTAQTLSATGRMNIDISRQGFILAQASGGGFNPQSIDRIVLDMTLNTYGNGVGWNTTELAKRGDAGFLPLNFGSCYLARHYAADHNDLAVYAHNDPASAFQNGRLQIDYLRATRCHTAIKLVRGLTGANIGRIEIEDGFCGLLMGETSGVVQGGAHHIGSIVAHRTTQRVLDIREQYSSEGRDGIGIRIDSVQAVDVGRVPGGATVQADAAGLRFASASGVSIGYYEATFKDWATPTAIPAVLINSGEAVGNAIDGGFISGWAVGVSETGTSTERIANRVRLTMKGVTTPLDLLSDSRMLYDLNLVAEAAGVVSETRQRRMTVHQTYTPTIYLGTIGSAPTQTVAQADYVIDADGRCTIAIESQVNSWSFTATGAELRLELPSGIVPVAGSGAEQHLACLMTLGFIVPSGTFGVFAELVNGNTYMRFRANVRDGGTGVVSQVILTDAHMQTGVNHAVKVTGTFKLTDDQP